LSSGFDWAIVLDIGVGLGVLLIGVGVFVVCSALAKLFARLNGTLDEVDRQISALSAPMVETLGHVGGIADSADTTVARLGAVVNTLEGVAANVGGTAKLATEAVAPALVNVGATLTGITAGLRRLVTGRRGASTDGETAGG
jgi:phage-related minor tail protein